MVGFTAAAAAIGIGTSLFGMSQSASGRAQAEEGYRIQQQGAAQQAEAARQAAGISKEQAASSVQYAGQERTLNQLASQQSIDASNASLGITRNIVASNQAIEQQKMQAMELDARRNQMEIIRNQQRSRALGLTNATASGSQRGSGLQGAYGQASGQTGINLLGVQQNLEVGRNIFAQNSNISNQNLAMADLQNMYAVQQANNQTTKSNMMYDYAVTNAGYQTRMADTQTLSAQGQGTISQGAGLVGMGNAQSQSGSQLMGLGMNIFSMGQNFGKLGGSSTSGVFGMSDPFNGYGGSSRFGFGF